MDFFTALRIGLGAVMANKLRSALTILGVTIGIAAVIGWCYRRRCPKRSDRRNRVLGTYLITVSIRGGARQGAHPKPAWMRSCRIFPA